MIPSRILGVLCAGLRRCDWRVPLVGAWAVFVLFPVWKTGWVHDDRLNSSLAGMCIHDNCTPLDITWTDTTAWMFRVGRIMPVSHLLRNVSFWLIRDVFWYKTALIAGVLLNLFVFYRLLKRLGASPDLAALCCLVGVTFIQLREFDDPVYSYNNLMQWLFLGTILSLSTFHRYLTDGRVGWLILSSALYLLTALTYEMTYIFWLLHVGIFLTTRGRWVRAAALAPFVGIALLMTLISMWLHTLPGYSPQGYAMDLNVQVVGATILKQLVGAWPGSYAAFDPSPTLKGVFSWKTVGDHLITLTIAFAASAILIAGMVRRGAGEQPRWAGLFILGLFLAVLPAPMLGVARKYQLVLTFGIAYLPVYIEYFGAALLLTCGVGFIAGRVRPGGATAKVIVGVASLLFAVVAVFHGESNNRVVAAMRQPYLTPRREVEEVLERGRLLEGVPAGATLVIDAFPWDTYGIGTYFYCYHTRTRLKDAVASHQWDPEKLALLVTKPGSEETSDVLRVRYDAPGTERGWAVAGKVHYLQASATGDVKESGISQLRLAVRRGWHMGPDRPFVVHAAYISPTGDAAPRQVVIGLDQMQRTAVTRNWTVYDVNIPVPYVDGESLWLEFNPPMNDHTSAALTAHTISR